MKKIILFFIIFTFQFSNLSSNEPKLEKIISGLKGPWSLTFINETRVLVTEKTGNIFLANINKKKLNKIDHNLNILVDGQGGLLEVLYSNEYVFVSYSENRGGGRSSTSVAKAKFNEKELKFKNIFRAEPPINSGYHFGSRLVIKDNLLYITAGERSEGMIEQDPTKH